jgi:hypothetical protein
MGRKPAKPKPKVAKVTLPAQAALDFPDDIWEKFGSKENERLIEKRRQGKRLNPLEEHLLLKYFPAQQKRVQKAKQSMETEREKQRSVEQASKQARNLRENRRDERDQLYARKV